MKSINVDFPKRIAQFESAMQRKFAIRSLFYRRIFTKGFEFETYRKYNEEDDAGLIDWKASLKARVPLVRQYIEEKNLKMFFIIDVGDNMIFGSKNQLKAEVAAEVAACLSHLIITSGDSVGFAMYPGEESKTRLFAKGIRRHYEFEGYLKNSKNYGGKSILKKILRKIPPYLKGASAIFLISDFIKMDQESFKLLKKLMSRYEVIGLMIRDPVDEKLPDLGNEVVVEDIYSGEQLLINPSLIQNEYRRNSLIQKRKIESLFKKSGSDLFSIYTDRDFILPLSDFLKSRIKIKNRVVSRKNQV